MNPTPKGKQSPKQTPNQFDVLLEAWRRGENVSWAELMAAWVQAPAAPRSPRTIERLIKHLDGK